MVLRFDLEKLLKQTIIRENIPAPPPSQRQRAVVEHHFTSNDVGRRHKLLFPNRQPEQTIGDCLMKF